jgi:hypothetical protein
MSTILQNIQSVCLEIGEPSPSSVIGTTDLTNLQLFAFMNRAGDMILSEHDWQSLTKVYQFSTVGFTYSGTMTAGSNIVSMANTSGITTDFDIKGDGIIANTTVIGVTPNVSVTLSNPATKSQSISLDFSQYAYAMPSDFHHIINDTSYDQSNRWEMESSTAIGWNYLKAGWLSGTTRVKFRILGDKFTIFPTQVSQRTFSFEYICRNYVTDNLGNTKEAFTADSDTCIFPDRIMIMVTKLLFMQQKGFDTSILSVDTGRELSKYKGQQQASKIINMGGYIQQGYLNIPEGNYGS